MECSVMIPICCGDWSDYNGVADFRILRVSRDSKWEDSRLKRKIRKLLFIKFNNKLTFRRLKPH